MGDELSDQVILRMKHITKTFPGVKALDDVSLELKAGEVHALLGENGAGKSTLIKVLGGIYHADSGEIEINGEKVSITSVPEAEAHGIAIIHQELVLVPYMTVAENIFLGRELGKGISANLKEQEKEAQAVLDRLHMNINAGTLVKDLSIAQQQMVEITKAIAVNAKILVMDEPTSSIQDREVENLFNIMRELTKQGVGIIYISHKMSELTEICDRVTVMRDGQLVGTKVVAETTRDELISMMVGRQMTNYYERDFQKQGEELLRVEHLSSGKQVRDVSFNIHKGEIVGFSGLVGAGRSETMEAIFGLRKKTGDIYVNNKKVSIKSPTDAMEQGIALVPENRKEEGLYLIQSVKYNTSIEVLDQFISKLRVNSSKENEIAQRYVDMMNTKTPSLEQKIGNLSGGNQQKVLIGRWLATDPKILILDEPTRGIDVGAKAEIYAIMNNLVKEHGVSIIMISSELPEIINMSDRVYVMGEGEVKGELAHDELSQEAIMSLAAI